MNVFCSFGQLENMTKGEYFGRISYNGEVTIGQGQTALRFEYKDYNHTFYISKSEVEGFCYFQFESGIKKKIASRNIEKQSAVVLESQNIAFFSSGKRVARIDMANNSIQTLEVPYYEDASYRLKEKSFYNNQMAYFMMEPYDDGPHKFELYEVDFKSKNVKKIFTLPILKNHDLVDVALEGDILFAFDIVNGIRIFDLKTGDQIRKIDYLDILPPIVLKDSSNFKSSSVAIFWSTVNNKPKPELVIRIDGATQIDSEKFNWDFDFNYDIRAGVVSKVTYENKALSKNGLTPIWVGDRYMYYEFVRFSKDELYIGIPEYPEFDGMEFSKKYYANYMQTIYKTKHAIDSIYEANKNSNKLFGNGGYINNIKDAIPPMYRRAQLFFFAKQEVYPGAYKGHKKERKIFGVEGKAEMDSLIPVLEREYARLIAHNNERLGMLSNAFGYLKVYADFNRTELIHSFEYGTKVKGIWGEKSQVEVTKVDKYGEYNIIFDLQKKEVLSTTRKTDF